MTYKWHGDKAKDMVAHVVENGLKDMATDVVKQAKSNANQSPPGHPQVQTGTLRRSIIMDMITEKGRAIAKVGIMRGKEQGDVALEYAPGLEFGTDRHPPYPFLYPAAMEITRRAKDYFG